jgi:hypothetical protein
MLELVRANLASPMLLAFLLGVAATLVRSDLRFPEELYATLSIYLLLAIGLKGGVALSQTPPTELLLPAAAVVALGCAMPLWCTWILQRFGRFARADAAAIAAHYGSVSAVTFLAATAFLDGRGERYEGYAPALVALLEVPAIVVALLLARTERRGQDDSLGRALHEVLAGKSIVLLLGGLAIGAIAGETGSRPVAPLFSDLFRGALTLFLLDMGMVAARRLGDLARVGPFLVAFGILAPIAHAVLGAALARAVGMSQGGAVILAVLAASASYIAAPAAVRIALPQANPTYYLTASLAITFPFNLALGIPLYHEFCALLYASWPP